MSDQINIYIHIPFCLRKCPYCSFFSKAGKLDQLPEYFIALNKEIKQHQKEIKGYEISTIYFGGGTPSLVDPENIKAVLMAIKDNYKVLDNAEISIETNPESLTEGKILEYKKIGINRISIGIQSFEAEILNYLGRLYSPDEAINKIKLVKKAKFDNFSLDLIFGIPGQTLADWQSTLRTALKLKPNHLSCYSLELDKDSVFGRQYSKGTLKPLSEKLDREMYKMAKLVLKEAGYVQYEISNWSLPDQECHHNLDFWSHQQYLGLGAGAHSFLNEERFNNVCNIEKYANFQMRNLSSTENLKKISVKQQMAEYLILQLRLNEGLSAAKFIDKFHKDPVKLFSRQFEKLKKMGLISISKQKIKPTFKGLDLWNNIAKEILNSNK